MRKGVLVMINSIIRYFDLFSHYRTTVPKAQAGGKKNQPTAGWQLSLFLSLALGIFAKGLLEYLVGNSQSPVVSWSRLVLAIVAAIVAFPGAYKHAMDESGPGLVQLCVTFTTGLGVKTLVDIPGGGS
jgi:hypothetical protein